MKNYISSTHIKAALLSYWRFKRQFNCVDEVSVCYTSMDIAIDTGGFLFEVEVKISKSDLIQGEKRKDKHKRYFSIDDGIISHKHQYIPNQFYICVPTILVSDTKEWIEKVNPKYGILEYRDIGRGGWEDMIKVTKKAKFLHENPITTHQKFEITHRLSSARCGTMQTLANQYREPVQEDYEI